MNSGWCVMKSVAGRSHLGWTPVRINFQEWRYNMGCMTCKNKNITQTMVDCSKHVCDVHFLLIWLLLIKDYTTNNLIKVWHWIDQIIFVYSLSKFLPMNYNISAWDLIWIKFVEYLIGIKSIWIIIFRPEIWLESNLLSHIFTNFDSIVDSSSCVFDQKQCDSEINLYQQK